jgi:hypothetical protein
MLNCNKIILNNNKDVIGFDNQMKEKEELFEINPIQIPGFPQTEKIRVFDISE